MILGAGVIGFLLGSRAGREPYEHLERRLQKIRRRPEVQDAVDSVQNEINQRSVDLSHKIQSTVSSSSDAGAA